MKNPWLSLWLSGANAWAGAARGLWAAELRKQQNSLVSEMTRAHMPRAGRTSSAKKRSTKRRSRAAR